MTRTTLLLAALLGAAAPDQPAARAQDEEVKAPSILTGKRLKAAAGDDELRRLLKERYNAALDEANAHWQQFLAGREPQEQLVGCFGRLRDAGLPVHEKVADRLAFQQAYVDLLREVEKISQAKYDAGRVPVAELYHARYLRLDAEIRLLQLRQDLAPPKKKTP
jgi:hypothetical protein